MVPGLILGRTAPWPATRAKRPERKSSRSGPRLSTTS